MIKLLSSKMPECSTAQNTNYSSISRDGCVLRLDPPQEVEYVSSV